MKGFKKILGLWAAMGLFAFIAACATTGEDFNYDGVKKIEKGKTTKEQILKLFGTPNNKGIENGRDRWTYEYNKKYLGGALYHKELVLIFNDQGKVVAYGHESNFP